MIDHFLGDAFGFFSCQFWSPVLQSGVRLPIHTLNYWTVQLVAPGSYLGVCLSVTLLIVDLLQFCVCCIRSVVTRCSRLMMRYLDRMCQCRLHVVPWSHIGKIMRHLATEPGSTAGLLFHSQCLSGTILLTLYSMVWDWRFSRGKCFFIGRNFSIPTIVFYYLSLYFIPV